MNASTKSVIKEFLNFFVPCVLMALSATLAVTVDRIFIGNFVSPLEMGAVNACVPISQLEYTIAVLIGAGAASCIAISKGKNESQKSNKIFGSSFLLSVIIGIVLTLCFCLFEDFICSVLIKDNELRLAVKDYYKIFIFLFIVMLPADIIQYVSRSDGFTKLGPISVIVANALNVFLDWLFIVPMKMGVKGAALGTIISLTVQLVINLLYFVIKKRTFRLCIKKSFQELPDVFAKGFPACIGTGLIVFKLIILNNLSEKTAGSTGLVVMSLTFTCLSIITIFSSGANAAMVPMIGKYYGEKNNEKLKATYHVSLSILFITTALTVLLLEIFPDVISFIQGVHDQETMALAAKSIRIFVIGFFGITFVFYMIYYLPIFNYSKFAIVLSIIEGFALVVPLSFLFTHICGFMGIWIANVLTELISVLLIIIYLKKRKIISSKES